MASASQIGILLSEAKSGKEVGFIEFTPSGVLALHYFQGRDVFALKPIERLLIENGLGKEPLYVKYAELLEREPELPPRILKQEASYYADFLNQVEPPGMVRGKTVKATVANYLEQDSE